MGGKLSPRFIPPSPFSAVFSLCVGVDGAFFFSLLQVDRQSAGPSGTDAAYSSAAGHKKTQAFPIAHPDLSNFRMKSGGRSCGNACVLLTDVAKRQTSAVFARIAQQDSADGHHAEEKIVVQMRNDLQGTERGQA